MQSGTILNLSHDKWKTENDSLTKDFILLAWTLA